jgi:hypothetical protein
MDFQGERVYTFELWSIAGIKVADISALAKNRKYTLERNQAETLEFTLDLDAFERFCASINTPPRNVLAPYQTEVKVKRNDVYIFGTQVVDCPVELGETAATITVKCTGYLNLFKDRYVTKTYTQEDAAAIARDLFMETQAQPYGSVGVTLDAVQYDTGVLRDREYTRDNVKDKAIALTSLVDGNFDIAISWDKKLRTYEQIGSLRSDLEFTYPGNIKSVQIERTGTSIFNKILGVGSGFGDDQITSTANDIPSQQAYYLREKIEQFNSVTVQSTLDQNTDGKLQMYKEVLEIPKITVTGAELDLDYVGIGDRIPVVIGGHAFVDNVLGLYRVEKMGVTIDDNDFESNIELYFDNLGVNQDEQA